MLIRTAAGYDVGRFEEVMDWPLRDLFLAYVERLRDAARRDYENQLLVWAALAPHQKRKTNPPDVPPILR